MLQLLKSRWELLVGLIFFTVAKLSALHYPFYWDESWSYAPGVKLMYLHGPSLMPDAIDRFYSRGHPPLFYAAAAAWMKVFGDAHIAQHAFALFISLLLICTVYEVALRMFNKRVAVLSLLLLPLQVIFYVQSAMLLPEMMVALFTLLTLYCYASGKYLYTFLSCTALVLTKESGMVLGAVLGAHAVINLFNKHEPLTNRLKNLLSVAGAGVIIGTFFLLQKHVNGWYLYPEHTGYIQLTKHIFWYKFMYALEILFSDAFRIRLYMLLLVLALIVAIPIKDTRYAAPLLPAYLVYATIENKFHFLHRKVMFALLAASLLIAAWQLLVLSAQRSKPKTRFVYLGVTFIVAYLVFSCINFFSARYLICILALTLIFTAAWLDVYISKLYDLIYYITVAGILMICYYGFKYDTGLRDKDMGAFAAMKVQEDVVTWLEQAGLYDRSIASSNFLNTEHLSKPYTGFLHTPRTFSNATYLITPATEYVIIDNIKINQQEANEMYDTVATSPHFRRVFNTEKGPAHAEVYERIK